MVSIFHENVMSATIKIIVGDGGRILEVNKSTNILTLLKFNEQRDDDAKLPQFANFFFNHGIITPNGKMRFACGIYYEKLWICMKSFSTFS